MAMTLIAAAALAASTAGLAPWRTPDVNEINRLPPRCLLVPCQTEDVAVNIAKGIVPRTESKWVMSLNGMWDFKWKSTPERDWEKTAKIAVPGCWQLQGDFDSPLYVNHDYPIGFDGTGDPMITPPENYTSFKMRNPVGLYTTTFKRPWRWWFRRTVLRFHGVSSAFYVRVNGKEVGYAEDSRLPSEFDLTPYLKVFGRNTLEVEVYKHSDGTYIEDQDFWRFSGIFRDVMLVSERKNAPKDFVVETSLSDDYTKGRFILRDENGGEIKVREVENPYLWSPEYPYVYITPVEHKWGWWIFGGTDYYTASFGFRRVEIRDSVVYLNGKRVLFKGVNRHEMHPEKGYTVNAADMRRDIDIFKEFNINAVRTCHYPNDPEWYDLTDREGVMVVCEANIESHGAGYGEKSLAKHAEWLKPHIERNERMVRFYRNHPSILIWSLGNEAGDGDNFAQAYKAVKAIDPTRPVQYERAENNDHTDIFCPMYMSAARCEKYVANKPAKPLVLCEYTHAMGNSNGGAQEYWNLAKKYPSFQGGFVWDFADQAIWKTDERGKWLAFGGDFGDIPNNDNFNCNGLFDALRNPHPGAYELKHAYQPMHVLSYDWETGDAKVENANMFTDLSEFDCAVTYSKDGVQLSKESLPLPDAEPGAVVTIKGLLPDADSVLFSFYRNGDLVAWDQFSKPFAPRKIDVATAQPVPSGAFKLNLWRAPTDNDRGWKPPMSKVCNVWKTATETQKLPEGVVSKLETRKLESGETLVDWTLTVPNGLPPIPRVGLSFTIPGTDRSVEWYGLGPWENYADRATGAILATHKAKIGHVSGIADAESGTIRYPADRLNPDNYTEPGEQGYRTGVRRLKVGQVEVEAVNAPFGFNAWPYPQSMLEGPHHQYDVTPGDELTINIDAVQMGVGGDDSWGAKPLARFMPGAGTYRLVFTVKGL